MFTRSGRMHEGIEEIFKDLEQKLEAIEDISEKELEKLESQILLVAHGKTKEGYSFAKNYWPYYYYSYPYESQVAWPPGLYSRLYNWQPGFTTSGWSYQLRPGIQYVRMPRARWFRNNGRYYYINNVY